MSREAVQSERAPAAVGPYSQACRARGSRTLYLSGQVPLDPATGQLVPGPAAAQAARCLESLKAVLEADGLGFADVVRCTIFLTDLADFGAVNEVYSRCFQAPFPARACVQVVALPRGARVEIDAVAERA